MAQEIITLTDSSTGAMARLLPGFGMNCYELQVPVGSRPIDVLWAEPDFASGNCRASGSGIPLLFPFPGRIAGTTLLWEGKAYELPEGDGLGNAIHGFVLQRPWRVLEQTSSRVVAQFHGSKDAPDLLTCWPADFLLTVTYEISGVALRTLFRIENPDERVLPCGIGTHPYFRVPLGGRRADDCVVRLPVSSTWELDNMLTTGKKRELHCAAEFQTGMRFGDMRFDNVFGDLLFEGDICTSSILDPDSGARMTMTSDRSFREYVVYTPPHREAICIEPYTSAPDAFRLRREGIDGGLRIIAPGQVFEASVTMAVGKASDG